MLSLKEQWNFVVAVGVYIVMGIKYINWSGGEIIL
jgi:hypothetical protein